MNNKKKLAYIANIRFPTEKAHGFQIAKMCESFKKSGLDVLLLVPDRPNPLKDIDPLEFYNTKDKFEHKKLPTWKIAPRGGFAGRIKYYLQGFNFASQVYKRVKNRNFDYIFSRDPFSALLLTLLGMKVCYEIHDPPKRNLRNRWLLGRIWKIVVTNDHQKEQLIDKFNMHENKIFVARNAVDLEEFNIAKSRDELRNELRLPLDAKIVMYVGKYATWKGLRAILNAVEGFATKNPNLLTKNFRDINSRAEMRPRLPYPDYQVFFCFVGITPESVSENGGDDTFDRLMRDVFRENYAEARKYLLFIPHQEHKKIPFYLKAADVLVIANTDKVVISKGGTSPIKLFEYMAAKVPILASDVPSIREIVDDGKPGEDILTFFVPDDAGNLVGKLINILNYPEKYETQTQNAWLKVQALTWENRAKMILEFLGK